MISKKIKEATTILIDKWDKKPWYQGIATKYHSTFGEFIELYISRNCDMPLGEYLTALDTLPIGVWVRVNSIDPKGESNDQNTKTSP